MDTSALYALFDRAQEENAAASAAWEELIRSDAPLFLSSYVLVELTALLQRRLGVEAVEALHEFVLPFVDVVWVDAETHGLAVSLQRAGRRRDVSLVDYSSFAVMRRRGVRRAFAVDAHFEEQGFDCLPG